MRTEKIKKYLIVILLIALVLLAPLSYLRVLGAAGDLWQIDLDAAFTGSHIITDRDGTALFDGECLAADTVGNLVGNETYIDNALYNRYKDEMTIGGLNPLVGQSSLKGTTFQTTLMPLAYQQQIKELYGDYDGACFAYNYQTGEVYIALSLPSGLGAGVRAGSMFNGCLEGAYVPASTMKILTTICALAQEEDLAEFKFTCRKSYELPDGNVINCHDYHGELGLSDALGESCNCYMAALITRLDVKQTTKTLAQLGILNENAEAINDGMRGEMDKLNYIHGRTKFTAFNEFQSVWGLIGQGNTRANPVYMAMVAGAVANGGKAAQPHIMQSIAKCGADAVDTVSEPGFIELIDSETAQMVKMAWEIAVSDHYRSDQKPISEMITLAKTGTAEEDNGINDRLLLGVMEEYSVAFFIIVEDSAEQNNLVFDVANLLAQAVSEM